MEIAEEEFQCPEDGGVLVFVKIIGRYAMYRCVNCNHLERKLMEEPKRKDTHEVPTLQNG